MCALNYCLCLCFNLQHVAISNCIAVTDLHGPYCFYSVCSSWFSLCRRTQEFNSLSDFICILKSMTKLKVCLQLHVSGDVVCGDVCLSVCLSVGTFIYSSNFLFSFVSTFL